MNANILEIIQQPDCPDILEFNPIIVIAKCGLMQLFLWWLQKMEEKNWFLNALLLGSNWEKEV